jgi:hypothetical protein
MHKIISPLRGEEVHGKDEAEYFKEIVSHIDTGVDHTFIFTVWEWPIVDPPEGAIVFSTSDESHKQPIQSHLHPNVLAVFKQYWPAEPICDKRVFPMPLGYLTKFGGNSNTPMREREFDYSFSGIHNDNGRDKMMAAANKRRKDGLKKYVSFTGNKWGGGMKMWDYGSLLTKTKIALCPPGFLSAESFRIFEAARCGCVLLVGNGRSHPFPKDVWYYKDFPGIMMDDWSDLSIIDELIADPERLQEISDETVKWYNRCIDPKAVGTWMTERIKERMNGGANELV